MCRPFDVGRDTLMLDCGDDVKNSRLATDRANQRVIDVSETDLLGAEVALPACQVLCARQRCHGLA
jgi:hypothetical protein